MAEMGTDMERFPTPGHLASWAGVCPGNPRSGEKRRRSPVRKGNDWLKPAPRFHEGRPWWRRPRPPGRPRPIRGPQYRRLARRIGARRAAMAVAHSIAVIIHHVIKDGQHFVDLGIIALWSETRKDLLAGPCAAWKVWVTKSPSNPPEHPIFRIMTG